MDVHVYVLLMNKTRIVMNAYKETLLSSFGKHLKLHKTAMTEERKLKKIPHGGKCPTTCRDDSVSS